MSGPVDELLYSGLAPRAAQPRGIPGTLGAGTPPFRKSPPRQLGGATVQAVGTGLGMRPPQSSGEVFFPDLLAKSVRAAGFKVRPPDIMSGRVGSIYRTQNKPSHPKAASKSDKVVLLPQLDGNGSPAWIGGRERPRRKKRGKRGKTGRASGAAVADAGVGSAARPEDVWVDPWKDRGLLAFYRKLAPKPNIEQGMQSFYRNQGRMNRSTEDFVGFVAPAAGPAVGRSAHSTTAAPSGVGGGGGALGGSPGVGDGVLSLPSIRAPLSCLASQDAHVTGHRSRKRNALGRAVAEGAGQNVQSETELEQTSFVLDVINCAPITLIPAVEAPRDELGDDALAVDGRATSPPPPPGQLGYLRAPRTANVRDVKNLLETYLRHKTAEELDILLRGEVLSDSMTLKHLVRARARKGEQLVLKYWSNMPDTSHIVKGLTFQDARVKSVSPMPPLDDRDGGGVRTFGAP